MTEQKLARNEREAAGDPLIYTHRNALDVAKWREKGIGKKYHNVGQQAVDAVTEAREQFKGVLAEIAENPDAIIDIVDGKEIVLQPTGVEITP